MSVSRETLIGDVSRETTDRLKAYIQLLLAWNRKINLISQLDEAEVWSRHVEDCLQLLPLIPIGLKSALDLGSGAGLPGLVLAIASGIPFTLVEADVRKCAFLREATRQTGATAAIVNARIEGLAIPKSPLITARALAPLPRLLDLAVPHLASGGILLFQKGAMVEKEIDEASRTWTMTIKRHISRTSKDGVILCISEVKRA